LHCQGKAAGPAPALRETLLAGALCNDAALYHEHRQWLITGDPTEAALLVLARKGGLDETTLRNVFPRQDELPFDSARQTMATLHEIEGRSSPTSRVRSKSCCPPAA
jgi:cation-transporting ATPase F